MYVMSSKIFEKSRPTEKLGEQIAPPITLLGEQSAPPVPAPMSVTATKLLDFFSVTTSYLSRSHAAECLHHVFVAEKYTVIRTT